MRLVLNKIVDVILISFVLSMILISFVLPMILHGIYGYKTHKTLKRVSNGESELVCDLNGKTVTFGQGDLTASYNRLWFTTNSIVHHRFCKEVK